jgi:DNA-binding LytR/AlgR family response regulator
MDCIIVDDDPLAQVIITQLVRETKNLSLVGVCNNADEAKELLSHTSVDLILLDIEMPSKSGIELLRSLHVSPIVVIISAEAKYAVHGFELSVADYLLKPIDPARFQQAIDKVTNMLALKKGHVEITVADFVFLKDKNILHRVSLNDLLWIEACGDYAKIHTLEKSFMVHSTLKALESKLPHNMVRIHRSFIVSLNKIDRIEENLVVIRGKTLPVSDAYWEAFKAKLNLL